MSMPRRVLAIDVTRVVPRGPCRSKTVQLLAATPSCSTRSRARRPTVTPTGGRESVSVTSALMCCTPAVPQFVARLVPSADAATAWNGVTGSPSTMEGAVFQ